LSKEPLLQAKVVGLIESLSGILYLISRQPLFLSSKNRRISSVEANMILSSSTSLMGKTLFA